MNDFKKAKITFALALLAALFALHRVVENVDYQKATTFTTYLGFELHILHAYLLLAGLLALTVYFYAVGFMTEHPAALVEKTGNLVYALAIMVAPVYGVLYLASSLAETLGQLHLYWAVPLLAAVVGLLLGWSFLKRLGERDHSAKVAQWADLEISSLYRARALFEGGHFDLSVMEAWKAIDARLHRVLAGRGITPPVDNPTALLEKARRHNIVQESAWPLLNTLREQWAIAVSHHPLTQRNAEAALTAARDILSIIALGNGGAAKPGL